MSNLYTYTINGYTWSTMDGCSMVHCTLEEVSTEAKFLTAQDVDVFTVCDVEWDEETLEAHVVEFLGNSKLWENAFSEIALISDFDANKICRQIEADASFRENFILANYDSCEVDGNLLHIYSTDGTGFTVGHNEERLGEIVG